MTAPHSPSGRHSCQTFTCQQSHVLSRGNREMNENHDREPTREPAAHSRLRARVQQPDVAGWRVSCVAVAACGMGTRSRQPGWPVTPRRWPSGGLCTGSARAVSSALSSRKPLFVSSFFSVTGEAHVTSASGAQHALRHARSLRSDPPPQGRPRLAPPWFSRRHWLCRLGRGHVPLTSCDRRHRVPSRGPPAWRPVLSVSVSLSPCCSELGSLLPHGAARLARDRGTFTLNPRDVLAAR